MRVTLCCFPFDFLQIFSRFTESTTAGNSAGEKIRFHSLRDKEKMSILLKQFEGSIAKKHMAVLKQFLHALSALLFFVYFWNLCWCAAGDMRARELRNVLLRDISVRLSVRT